MLTQLLQECLDTNRSVSVGGLLFEIYKDKALIDVLCDRDEGLQEKLKAWLAAALSTDQHHRCSVCGEQHVRLYRSYGTFLREDQIVCNAHVDGTDWVMPLVEDLEGGVWGYTSAPLSACVRFYRRPDATPDGPRWLQFGEEGAETAGWRKSESSTASPSSQPSP